MFIIMGLSNFREQLPIGHSYLHYVPVFFLECQRIQLVIYIISRQVQYQLYQAYLLEQSRNNYWMH